MSQKNVSAKKLNPGRDQNTALPHQTNRCVDNNHSVSGGRAMPDVTGEQTFDTDSLNMNSDIDFIAN